AKRRAVLLARYGDHRRARLLPRGSRHQDLERAAPRGVRRRPVARRPAMSNEARPRLLMINTGSSSVKLTVWGDGRALHTLKVAPKENVDLAALVAPFRPLDAVIHRVVHAGEVRRHTYITANVQRAIEEARPLAPLHNPMALQYIAQARAAFGPSMPQL